MQKYKRSRPTIGILPGWQAYPGTIHSFLDFVFRGVQAAANDFDCNLLFGCGAGSPFFDGGNPVLPLEQEGIDFIPVGPWNTDGLIAIGPLFHEETRSYFKSQLKADFPVVYAGNRQQGPAVIVNNSGGIQLAVEHLIKHGHSRIAFISGYAIDDDDSSARLGGYLAALQQFGLPYDPGLVEQGMHIASGGYAAIRRIIERVNPFTAVIVSNDESAVGVIDGLRSAGLSVPQDVAVIGFDDRLEARAQIPLLTTVHLPMFEMGYRSVDLLLKIMRGEARPDTLLTIPTHLVVRESCGCTPGVMTVPPVEFQPVQPVISHTFSDYSGPGKHDTLTARPALQTNPFGYPDPQYIARVMAEQVYKEMQCLNRSQVEGLCLQLLDSYMQSLAHGNTGTFRRGLQQVLDHVVSVRDEIYAWQNAITVLREWTALLLQPKPGALSLEQASELLHQARIAIAEMLRGHYSRQMVQEAAVANLITVMSSRFFAAETEAEVFNILREILPEIGIQSTSVVYYQPDKDEKFARGKLQMTFSLPSDEQTFSTRAFPPPGLYPENRPFQLVVIPLHSPDGPLGFIAFQAALVDSLGFIVRQLVAALRNVHLYQQAVEARRLAEEANYLKSRFLSIVSHELRTPLNLIFGLSNMMLEESRPVNNQESIIHRKDLERIYIGAQHLESLIRDVLDLASSDVGQLDLTYEKLDLREVVEAVSAIGEPLARDKELSWEVRIPTGPALVRGDRTRLRQIVLNLVNNAVKFTVHGGIRLSVNTENGWATVSISDTGLGIPVNEQCAIFDEFHQSARTTARGFGGLGLGLSICKRLVEMHDGKIGVYSSGIEGTGSTFYFHLPLVDANSLPVLQPQVDAGAKHVLLLVKDTEGGDHLRAHLASQGYLVEVHATSEDLDWMNCLLPHPPEKIIIDLGLTSERGWDILKTLKENPATREIPVLFYSLDEGQDRGAMLDLNIMNKPLSTAELAQVLLPHHLADEASRGSLSPAILVVDDDPEILRLHVRIVETLASSYRVLQAKNGREALDLIRAERPALVLLDLMMPEVDGFEVLETMQSEDLARSVPVIVLTGQVLTQEDMERLNSGVASVLGKGMFNSQETLNHISAALENTRRPGSETQRTVMRAMAFIHQSYTETVSRSDIAAHVGLSERHLSRLFHQEVGLTPMSYLNRYRVQQAKKMLEEGKRCITDIALEVGFSNSGYFTRVFREEVGVSPREYLLSNGKNGSNC
jgi:signal transduction histidine kinase/DNA-binding response OmpR family regulator/ABC-type sugar transport system substrate-binding protein